MKAGENDQGSIFQDVIHGGEGDDLIYGGTDNSLDGAQAGVVDFKYLYGDEGHDTIYGSSFTDFQYIWGGEGDDII